MYKKEKRTCSECKTTAFILKYAEFWRSRFHRSRRCVKVPIILAQFMNVVSTVQWMSFHLSHQSPSYGLVRRFSAIHSLSQAAVTAPCWTIWRLPLYWMGISVDNIIYIKDRSLYISRQRPRTATSFPGSFPWLGGGPIRSQGKSPGNERFQAQHTCVPRGVCYVQ